MINEGIIFTLFGASGDLAKRKLYPALYQLFLKKHLPDSFVLLGSARREWSNQHFREVIAESIHQARLDARQLSHFMKHCYYISHNASLKEDYPQLKAKLDELAHNYQAPNRIFYLSLAPELFPTISRYLKEEAIMSSNGFNRLVIEKPFGYNQASADQLQKQLCQSFEEEQIFRMDHYLGKSIVNQILPIRQDNPIFRQLWQPEWLDHIQISLNEDLGVAGRAGYYEQAGVARDMIQNHALQLLTLVTLSLDQSSMDSDTLRQRKIQILDHLKLADPPIDHVVRGQYSANSDLNLPSYRQEDQVDPQSQVETFLAFKAEIDLPEWQGVPIYIRSGKALSQKQTDIKLIFKNQHEALLSNFFQIKIAPDPHFNLQLNQQDSWSQHQWQPLNLEYRLKQEHLAQIPSDYEKLILDCIEGNLSSFAHALEVKYAWRFIDQIRQIFTKKELPLHSYPAASRGPVAAYQLLQKDHRHWIDD